MELNYSSSQRDGYYSPFSQDENESYLEANYNKANKLQYTKNTKNRNKNNKKSNPFEKDQKINFFYFYFKENKLVLKKFCNIGSYSPAAIILGVASSNEYFI